MAGYVVQLDPSAVASDRTMLDLNSGPIRVGGASPGTSIDWGDAAISEYTTDAWMGTLPVDYRIPNRTIKIPLALGMDESGTEESVRSQLQQKVALLQREGGWLLRQRDGGPAMYADVVDAVLTLPDVWGEAAGLEPDVVLQLTCLPDFYGDEVSLDLLSGAGCLHTMLLASGVQAVVSGDYPSRVRLVVSDSSGHDQLGLLWGFRSRHYDSASTAALFYEAEALTPLSGAVVTAESWASGGETVYLASLVGGAWVPVLSTQLAAGGAQLSHQGSYRVWARVVSGTAVPYLRLAWAVGDLANPVYNDSVQVPAADAQYLVDLGEIRLDAPPSGPMVWQGVVQAMGISDGDPIEIDCLYLQPLDESAGYLQAVQPVSASIISKTHSPSAAADLATGAPGAQVWSNPANAETDDGNYASATGVADSTVYSHYLTVSGLGFTIPTGSTVTGIAVAINRYYSATSYLGKPGGSVTDQEVKLMKAAAVQSAANRADTADTWPLSAAVANYGGNSDLWGNTWTPSDVNDSGFGVALAVAFNGHFGPVAYVDSITVTVYFTLAGGFSTSEEAVIYANQSLELRHDGAWRYDPTGAHEGAAPVPIGDLPRLPPSGIESRPIELFVKPTRGDIFNDPDSGLDSLTVQVKYRPTYLSRP